MKNRFANIGLVGIVIAALLGIVAMIINSMTLFSIAGILVIPAGLLVIILG